MKITYDPEARAHYIQFREIKKGEAVRTEEEVCDGYLVINGIIKI